MSNESPSDHFMPRRKVSVRVVESSDNSHARTTLVTRCRVSGPKVAIYWAVLSIGLPISPDTVSVWKLPPYTPMASRGRTTITSCGSRSSTGGSVPSATRAASIGASLNRSMLLPVACSYSSTVWKIWSTYGSPSTGVPPCTAAPPSSSPLANSASGTAASNNATMSAKLNLSCIGLPPDLTTRALYMGTGHIATGYCL